MRESINDPDQRSRKFIFVPFCLLCQAFQARGLVRLGFTSIITPILNELLKHDVNLIQLPCPESKLGGYREGLKRKPKGISQYDTPEFRRLCENEAREVAEMAEGIISNGYEVVGILGVEYSPSCATEFQYGSGFSTIRRKGLFIEALQCTLKEKNITIPFIGVNRRSTDSAVKKIRGLFEKSIFD